MKSEALKTLFTAIKNTELMNKKLPIRIVFGLSSKQGITDKNAAKELLVLSQKYKNITVKKINNPKFHPKMMIFYGKPNTILLGSSNLTKAAQTKNLEANILVNDPDLNFFNDVCLFFKKCWNIGKTLELEHVESYIQHKPTNNKKSRKFPKEDIIPSTHTIPVTSVNSEKGIGQSKKSKEYYDKKIDELEKIENPTDEQKKSLAAYRAHRTRRFGKNAEKMDILLSVVKGLGHLKNIQKSGEGKWTIGKSVNFKNSVNGRNAYFYENGKKKVSTVGEIVNIKIQSGQTIFSLKNIKKINDRKLGDFKKRNGKPVKFVGSFAYVYS